MLICQGEECTFCKRRLMAIDDEEDYLDSDLDGLPDYLDDDDDNDGIPDHMDMEVRPAKCVVGLFIGHLFIVSTCYNHLKQMQVHSKGHVIKFLFI